MKHIPKPPFTAGRARNKRLYIHDSTGKPICSGFSSLMMPEKVAAMMASAVNNTYGNGIRPGAVPDLLEALKVMTEYFEWAIKDPDFHAYKIAKEAIEQSKL